MTDATRPPGSGQNQLSQPRYLWPLPGGLRGNNRQSLVVVLGEGKELRTGANGWVCRPDDPTTPSDDPRCLDENWRKVFGMEFGPEREALNVVGFAYMLQGDSVADNDDPSVMQPPPGEEWQIDGPHIMIVSSHPWDPAFFSRDHQSGGPWIMFGGTPAEHLMVPVTGHSH